MRTDRKNPWDISVNRKQLNESRRETRLYYGFGVSPAKAIKVCGRCGAVCKAAENYCTECGARLPAKNLYEISIEDAARCPHCGVILEGSEKFCPLCGKSLQTAE